MRRCSPSWHERSRAGLSGRLRKAGCVATTASADCWQARRIADRPLSPARERSCQLGEHLLIRAAAALAHMERNGPRRRRRGASHWPAHRSPGAAAPDLRGRRASLQKEHSGLERSPGVPPARRRACPAGCRGNPTKERPALRERRERLRLRGHSTAHRLATGEQRQPFPRPDRDRFADALMENRRPIDATFPCSM